MAVTFLIGLTIGAIGAIVVVALMVMRLTRHWNRK